MITIVKTILSFISPFIDKIFGKNSERALELKAQKELEELQAFKAGRITPRFMLFYALVGIFVIFAMLFICGVFFPTLVNLPDTSSLKDILDMGSDLLP